MCKYRQTMTDSGYFVGQVADLLGGGKKSKPTQKKNNKLASLFEVKSEKNTPPKSDTNEKNKKIDKAENKKKKKKDQSDENISSKSDTKLKKKKQKKNDESDEKQKSQDKVDMKTKKMKNDNKLKKKQKQSKESDKPTEPKEKKTDGFCPPKGIVHESLKKESKEGEAKKGKKRKHEDDASDDDEPKKKRKNHKRDKTKDKRTVFVGNLPLDCKKTTVKSMFSEFGKIESIRYRCPPVADPKVPKKVTMIKKEFHPGRSNIVSFICYEDMASAEKALTLNGHELSGFHLRVDLASNEKKHNKHNSVFIGNLPFDIEENVIWKHFEDCGEIENVRVVRDRKTGLGKGFGYVLFKDKSSVDLAQKLQDSTLKGRQIRVDKCKDQTKTPVPKFHPAHQRLMKKAKKTGVDMVKLTNQKPVTKPTHQKFRMKPSNLKPGEKRKVFKKKDKSSNSKLSKTVDRAFAAPRTMPTSNKHIKFD